MMIIDSAFPSRQHEHNRKFHFTFVQCRLSKYKWLEMFGAHRTVFMVSSLEKQTGIWCAGQKVNFYRTERCGGQLIGYYKTYIPYKHVYKRAYIILNKFSSSVNKYMKESIWFEVTRWYFINCCWDRIPSSNFTCYLRRSKSISTTIKLWSLIVATKFVKLYQYFELAICVWYNQ